MSIRKTLGLGGLAAALVLSLAIVSSASASPYDGHKAGITLHRSGLWVAPRSGGSPVVGSRAVTAGRRIDVGPAARRDDVGVVPAIPVTTVAREASSGFSWKDAAIGTLFGVSLAIIAISGVVMLRGRRGGMALGA